MVKVLIVDDSAFMRNAIASMLRSDPELSVIGTAKNGLEAIAMVKNLKPDIVTMDVEMPRMDGIQALRYIMRDNPLPVLMVSSLTAEGAKATLDALDLGAVDFIPKNLSDLSVNILKIKEILVEKIKVIAHKGIVRSRNGNGRLAEKILEMPKMTTGERRVGVLAIGTSTGGPKALQTVVASLPPDFPVPVVIAQHMPPNFTGPFAERLDSLSRVRVKEAEAGDRLVPGLVLVAPGSGHMKVKRTGAIDVVVRISETRGEFLYRPSVDALLSSVSEAFPGRTLGVVLTGMGDDGLKGAQELKGAGSRVFVQDEDTCVVWGMPRAVIEAGLADKVLPIEKMAGEIVNSV